VGRQAARLTHAFYRGAVGGEASGSEAIARCSGYLIYAMELYGCNFEAVVDLSDYVVARTLSQISPNSTLSAGQRRNDLISRLAQADVVPQLVRLAELSVTVNRILQHVTMTDLKRHHGDLKRWLDDTYSYLQAMHKLRSHKKTALFMDDTRTLLNNATAKVEAVKLAVRTEQKAQRLGAAAAVLD